ncbi:hypothetical protein V5H80_03890 [Helicobacter pylori]
MIKLKGLNKILRTWLLAGALLGVTTPLMAKPLFTDTDLIDYLSKSKAILKKNTPLIVTLKLMVLNI